MLWSDATVRRKTQEDFKAVDVEATPVVPDNNLHQLEDAVSENRWDPLLFDATLSPFPYERDDSKTCVTSVYSVVSGR